MARPGVARPLSLCTNNISQILGAEGATIRITYILINLVILVQDENNNVSFSLLISSKYNTNV